MAPPSQPQTLSESDCIVAASVVQEVSALRDQPELNPIADRLRQHADQARLGPPGVSEGASAEPPVDGAVAREELRIKALWEGRLQVLRLALHGALALGLAWTIWDNRGLRDEIRQLREVVGLVAETQLNLAEEVRSQE